MKENRINATIAITFFAAAVIMLGALSLAIGKWSMGGSHYDFTIQFPNATGISANSEVKYAGAVVGRVKEISLIPRDKQNVDLKTNQFNCVNVVVEINHGLEIGNDSSATIKQDGIGIAAKYVLLTPGPDPHSKLIADGDVMQGDQPFDLADLIQPAGQALTEAKTLVTKLQPVVDRLDLLSQTLSTQLPPMINHADKFLQDGDGVIANFNTPAGRQRLNDMMDSLRVSTENLKVVSTNAKALTATLAEKPWRVFWGGSTITPPSEDQVLKSNKVLRLKPEVDVNADQASPPSRK